MKYHKTLLLLSCLLQINCIPILAHNQADANPEQTQIEMSLEQDSTLKPQIINSQELIQIALIKRHRYKLTFEQKQALYDAYLQIKALKKDNDVSMDDSIRNLDHRTALRILNKTQFRWAVQSRYLNLNEEIDKIWSAFVQADMVSDLNEEDAQKSIKNYLIKLKVAAETYWNDEEQRRLAQHQVKAYAPQVVKRYFATKPKRKHNPNAEFTNYLW